MAFARRLKLVTADMERFASGTAVKVAFATSDMKRVDQHFGVADAFAVYTLSPGQARLAEVVQFGPPATGGSTRLWGDTQGAERHSGSPFSNSGHSEGKLVTKIDALKGCIAVYCQAVGAAAIDQLHVKGIRPVKVVPGTEIRDLLETLQEELTAGKKGWLAHAIARHKPQSARRFDDMEQEGWIE